MQKLKVLVACEYSGRVRDAFRALGHDAWSCDVLPTEADPEFHIEAPVQSVLHLKWDLMIAHPPCTFMANSGSKHLYLGMKKENGRNEERWKNRSRTYPGIAEAMAEQWGGFVEQRAAA